MIVETSAGKNAGIHIGDQTMGSAVIPGELNSTLLLRCGINDVGVESVHVVVAFGKRAIELPAQTEIDGELGRKPVVVLDIACEIVQVLMEDRIRCADARTCGQSKFKVG